MSDPNTTNEFTPVIIEPPRSWAALNLRDAWAYRELFWTLAVRDLKVRYKQTELGAAWAIIQPLLTMVIFSAIFGGLAGFAKDTQGIPYPVFTYVGLLPWTFFSGTITRSSQSMVSSASLITKVYFPRLIIPFSTVVTGIVDFGVAFVVLLGMLFFYRITPTWGMLALPLLLLLATLCAIGTGLWLSALNVEYRDVGYIVPFLMQMWMYLTPVAYPASVIPAKYQFIYSLNPMTGVVEGFRWAFFEGRPFPATALGLSVGFTAVLMITGLYYFRHMERTFADVV